jgi:hypothetical protein
MSAEFMASLDVRCAFVSLGCGSSLALPSPPASFLSPTC